MRSRFRHEYVFAGLVFNEKHLMDIPRPSIDRQEAT
jgi:hypothetical protein